MELKTHGLNTHKNLDKFVDELNVKIEKAVVIHVDYILDCIKLPDNKTFETLGAKIVPDNATDRGSDWLYVEFDFKSNMIPHFLFDDIRSHFTIPYRTSDSKHRIEIMPNFSDCKIYVRIQKIC